MRKTTLFGKVLVLAFIAIATVSSASAAGKKYGLFVGINAYGGGINPLKGCVNDATKMRDTMVTKFGFNAADTMLLTDGAATRAAIMAALQKYQTLVGPGDLFVFHYSGHGTLFPDSYSAEQDETKMIYMESTNDKGQVEVMYERGTYDSAIVPVNAMDRSDKPWRNLILDDELYAVFSGVTRKGAQGVLISDSCHSGSIDRAKKSDTRKRETPLVSVFGAKRYSELDFGQPAAKTGRVTPAPVKGLYLSMTGSKDDEFSLDASIGGVPMGLFTNKLLASIPASPAERAKMTYSQLMARVSSAVSAQALKWEGNQNPQFNSDFGNPNAVIFSLPAATK
ncbi:MAG: hypothetical protein DMF63_01830 [Acidobacteria bacterium]|nr:MAG: hypothetical protein DMF63_01830 [Acidobacteriota bacterium]